MRDARGVLLELFYQALAPSKQTHPCFHLSILLFLLFFFLFLLNLTLLNEFFQSLLEFIIDQHELLLLAVVRFNGRLLRNRQVHLVRVSLLREIRFMLLQRRILFILEDLLQLVRYITVLAARLQKKQSRVLVLPGMLRHLIDLRSLRQRTAVDVAHVNDLLIIMASLVDNNEIIAAIFFFFFLVFFFKGLLLLVIIFHLLQIPNFVPKTAYLRQ